MQKAQSSVWILTALTLAYGGSVACRAAWHATAPIPERASSETALAANDAQSPPARTVPEEEPLSAAPTGGDKAMAFRAFKRSRPSGVTPRGAVMKAKRQRDALIAKQRNLPGHDQSLTNVQWTALGPGNIGGRIRSILIHPTKPEIMWVGGASGGIWKTYDGGASWAPQDDFMASLSVSCMAMHPTQPDVLYAGTGEGNFRGWSDGEDNAAAMRGAGIFKSTDGGEFWTQLPSTQGQGFEAVTEIAISPTDPNRLLVATDDGSRQIDGGIYLSTDGGQTFDQTFPFDCQDVKFNPHTDIAFPDGVALCSSDGIVTRSTDGGQTWDLVNNFDLNSRRTELAFAHSTQGIVYATCDHGDSDESRIYKSTDHGLTFQLVNNTVDFLGEQGKYANAIWVDPTNSEVVVVGGLDLYRSTNGGSNFDKISDWKIVAYPVFKNSAHADHHVIIEHPDYDGILNAKLFFGNDGGIYSNEDIFLADDEVGWAKLNNGLEVTQFYSVDISRTGRPIGGAQDNGTIVRSAATNNWNVVHGGDGGYCAADPLSSRLYLTIQEGKIARKFYFDGGDSEYISGGIPDANAPFIAAMIMDPNNTKQLLTGRAHLWRTPDATVNPADAVSWTKIFQNPDTFEAISAIAVQPGNSQNIWVGTDLGSLYKTPPGWNGVDNQNWIKVDVGYMPDRYISDIHFVSENIVYVTYMGYASDNFWETEDGGLSWPLLIPETPLPESPISSIQGCRGIIYVGTDIGVFVSDDGGENWGALTGGLPSVEIDQLLIRETGASTPLQQGNSKTFLYAATFGRGVWKAEITSALCRPCQDFVLHDTSTTPPVSVDRDVLVVGAPSDDEQGTNRGAVYVYRWGGGTWLFEQKIFAPPGNVPATAFGGSVSVSGTALMISDNFDANGAIFGYGSVYIYRLNGLTWEYEATLPFVPQYSQAEAFNESFSGGEIRGDYAIVQSTANAFVGISGAAHVFQKDPLAPIWNIVVHIKGLTPPADDDRYASSVAIRRDGVFAIGSSQMELDFEDNANNRGLVELFQGGSLLWSEYGEAAQDQFGYDVAIDGESLIIGAPGTGFSAGKGYGVGESGGGWGQMIPLILSSGRSFRFGSTVSVAGGIANLYSGPSAPGGSFFRWAWNGSSYSWQEFAGPTASGGTITLGYSLIDGGISYSQGRLDDSTKGLFAFDLSCLPQ